ncbi:MAG: transporter substrate-binding domain-containing protein, partial [Fusobacteriaceae bacterium]
MKNVLRNLVMVILTLVLGVSAFGKERLYVGSNIDFPPFEFFEKNEIVGFDIDLIKEVAKRLNMDIKIENMNFDALLPALQAKKVDVVVSGMTITEERKKSVLFTAPYFEAKQVLIVKDNSKIKSVNDLKGKKVAAGLGYTGDIMLTKLGGVNVIRVTDPTAGILQVKTD